MMPGTWSSEAYSTAVRAGLPVSTAMVPTSGVSSRNAVTACGSALACSGSGTIGESVPSKSVAISALDGSARSAATPARPSPVSCGCARLSHEGTASGDMPPTPCSAAAAGAQLAPVSPPLAQPSHQRGIELHRLRAVNELVQQLVIPGRGKPEGAENFPLLGAR